MTLLRDKLELLQAFRRGERAALETVYRHYVLDVARILRLGFVSGPDARLRIPPLHDDASLRDAIQEVFMRAFEERARLSYDGLRPYRPFLVQIARNLRVDQLRRARRELASSSFVEGSAGLEGTSELGLVVESEPQVRREWDAMLQKTQRYLATLDEKARQFVELRFVHGAAQAHVAERMGVTRRHVRTLEARVLNGLKRFLKR